MGLQPYPMPRPARAGAYFNRGKALDMLGRHQEAQAAYADAADAAKRVAPGSYAKACAAQTALSEEQARSRPGGLQRMRCSAARVLGAVTCDLNVHSAWGLAAAAAGRRGARGASQHVLKSAQALQSCPSLVQHTVSGGTVACTRRRKLVPGREHVSAPRLQSCSAAQEGWCLRAQMAELVDATRYLGLRAGAPVP